MRDAVTAAVQAEGADVLVMAAAVADYRPGETDAQKIKKTGERLTLELARTPDILGEVAGLRAAGRGPRVVVGFAAETAGPAGERARQAAAQTPRLDCRQRRERAGRRVRRWTPTASRCCGRTAAVSRCR